MNEARKAELRHALGLMEDANGKLYSGETPNEALGTITTDELCAEIMRRMDFVGIFLFDATDVEITEDNCPDGGEDQIGETIRMPRPSRHFCKGSPASLPMMAAEITETIKQAWVRDMLETQGLAPRNEEAEIDNGWMIRKTLDD